MCVDNNCSPTTPLAQLGAAILQVLTVRHRLATHRLWSNQYGFNDLGGALPPHEKSRGIRNSKAIVGNPDWRWS